MKTIQRLFTALLMLGASAPATNVFDAHLWWWGFTPEDPDNFFFIESDVPTTDEAFTLTGFRPDGYRTPVSFAADEDDFLIDITLGGTPDSYVPGVFRLADNWHDFRDAAELAMGNMGTMETTLAGKQDASSAFSGVYGDLTGKPALFDGAYASLTGKPMIPTDTSQLTNGAGYLTAEVDGSTTNEIELPSQSGQSGKVLSTNGSAPAWITPATGSVTSVTAGTGLSGGTVSTTGTISLPNTGTAGTYGLVTTDAQGRVTSGKHQETYSGTTNGSGVYTVTFGTAYAAAPNIQANLIGGADNQNLRITAVSTTGFTVLARTRVDVIGLLPTWNNASGLSVDALITEK